MLAGSQPPVKHFHQQRFDDRLAPAAAVAVQGAVAIGRGGLGHLDRGRLRLSLSNDHSLRMESGGRVGLPREHSSTFCGASSGGQTEAGKSKRSLPAALNVSTKT